MWSVSYIITGVPGSGKTLVGLDLAFSKGNEAEPIHFMSGNGPLVKVLQMVLARHQMRRGLPEEFEATAAFLLRCGATKAGAGFPDEVAADLPQGLLF